MSEDFNSTKLIPVLVESAERASYFLLAILEVPQGKEQTAREAVIALCSLLCLGYLALPV